MSIRYNEKDNTLSLATKTSLYQMKIDEIGTLLHVYYGEKTDEEDLSYAVHRMGRGFSGNPHEKGGYDRSYSFDFLPQEMSFFGTGDYRITAMQIREEGGEKALRLRYDHHEIKKGKYRIPGLPSSYDDANDADTLIVTMKDTEANVKVLLYYGVFENADVITRAAEIVNEGTGDKILEKAGSMNLDFISGDFDLITFYGKWAREREMQRMPLHHGVQSLGSVRGSSSSHYNPSCILCDHTADEDHGNAYGFAFVYSSDFLMEVEKDMIDQTRLIFSIHPNTFNWLLQPGENFYTPEVILTYSGTGLSGVSNRLHDFIRRSIVRGKWRDARRPVLINNWEGTYFKFTGDKLVSIAQDAAALGVEMFVLDDGWFGKREDDNSGLGDWFPNEKKLGCTLDELGKRITSLGIKFGIWFEPEAISEDSDLYRAHPDWAITIPGREPDLSRNELLLNLGLTEVQDYLIERMCAVIREGHVSYVKWDYNRNICDSYSYGLPKERQGEVNHRFVLGTYRVLETLLKEFPDLLIEGCSGGGGRFDAGMMHYTPQIWCSDDTDPIERLKIQYGTSFIYPVNTMGAHVSASPNHQTGRPTPMETRATVAMSGTFGYELDVNKLTPAEKVEMQREIGVFKELCDTIEFGDYYRLTTPDSPTCTVWEEVSKNGKKAVVNAVYHYVRANHVPQYVKLKGLNEKKKYTLRLVSGHGEESLSELEQAVYAEGRTYSGKALMTQGLYIPEYGKEYQSWQIVVEEVKGLF